MLHVVGLHVLVVFHVMGVEVIARHLAHVHVRRRWAHVAMHFRRHARHGNVRVVDIAFGEIDAFFRLFQVFFGEGGAVWVCVVGTTVLSEVV